MSIIFVKWHVAVEEVEVVEEKEEEG